MFRSFLGLMALAACALLAIPAAAIDVQPVVNVINLPEDQRGVSIVIRNPREVDLPIEFDIVERSVNPDGSETSEPADDQFVIFPAQTLIPPGQSRTVRVQYVGPALDTSRSFTMYTTELPIAESEIGNSGVQRILRMGASVHVAPQGVVPEPVLEASRAVENGVEVSIRNGGNRFLYVDNVSLEFGDTTIEGYELANIAERTLIPPGALRTFVVPGVSGEPKIKLLTPFQ